jgi:hypothetical protein
VFAGDAGRGGEFRREARPTASVPDVPHGTPSHDHLGDIFAIVEAAQFQMG